jgi:hypothetical protein
MTSKLKFAQLTTAGILAIAAPSCLVGISAVAQSTVNQSTVNQSTVNQSTANQASANQASADQATGVSHPENLPNDVNSPPPSQALSATGDHYVKPSAGVPLASADDSSAATDRYVPSPTPVLSPRTAPIDTDAPQETAAAAPSFVVTDDVNSGVVTELPAGPNELPIGTVLRAELQSSVSTAETRAGSPFTATLTHDVTRHSVVLLPVGSVITGRVTQVRGGHAIGGAAVIRLQPDRVSLPDGTTYRLDADVIDLDHSADSHVSSEGAIVDNSHTKETLAVLGGATGVAAVSGAAVGGPVGAAVGAGIGAGVGTIWWLKHDRQEMLPEGTSIVFALNDALHLTPQGK